MGQKTFSEGLRGAPKLFKKNDPFKRLASNKNNTVTRLTTTNLEKEQEPKNFGQNYLYEDIE